MGDQLVRMKTLLLLHHSTSHEIGVPIHFLQVMIEIPEWILQDMLLEISGDAVQFEPFMDQVIPITHPVLPEQLGLPVIGIPAPMSNPASQKIVLARDEIGVGIGAPVEQRLDLIAK